MSRNLFFTDFAEMYREYLDKRGWPQFSAYELLFMKEDLHMNEKDVEFLISFINVWETFENEQR